MNSHNRNCVERFIQERRVNEIGESTIAVDLQVLNKLGGFLGDRRFEEATKEDMIRFFGSLRPEGGKEDYKPSTLHVYKRKVKLFYGWLSQMDRGEYPQSVKWIRSSNPRSTKSGGKLTTLTPSEVLNENDIMKFVEACEDHKHKERDQAIIMLAYDSGARARELLKLKVAGIQLLRDSGVVTLKGRRGARRIPFVVALPYVIEWLNKHPRRHDPNAPLWLSSDKRTKEEKLSNKAMKYDMFYDLLKELKRKTGLAKPLHPHSLRHARLTELAKKLTEAQLKTFAGWTPGSRMSGVYVHLSGSDLEKPILSIYGKGEGEKAVSPLTPKRCPRCEMENPATSEYCQRCGLVLDKDKVVMDLIRRDKEIEKLKKEKVELEDRIKRTEEKLVDLTKLIEKLIESS